MSSKYFKESMNVTDTNLDTPKGADGSSERLGDGSGRGFAGVWRGGVHRTTLDEHPHY